MADLDHLHVSFQSLQQAEMEAKKLYGSQADISKRIVPYLQDGILHFEARQKGFLWGMKSLSRQFAGREGIQTGRSDILGALGQLTTAQEPQTNPKLQGLISRTALAAEHIFGKKALSGQERLQNFGKQNTRTQAIPTPHEKAGKALEAETDRLVDQLEIRGKGNFLPPGRAATLAQYRERVMKEALRILRQELDTNRMCDILDSLSSLSQAGNSLAKDLWQALKTVSTYQNLVNGYEERENENKEKLATALIDFQKTCPLLFRLPVARISPLTHPAVRLELEELDKIEHMPTAQLQKIAQNASPVKKARAEAALDHELETLEKLNEAKQKAQTYGEFQEQVVKILQLESRSEKELLQIREAFFSFPLSLSLSSTLFPLVQQTHTIRTFLLKKENAEHSQAVLQSLQQQWSKFGIPSTLQEVFDAETPTAEELEDMLQPMTREELEVMERVPSETQQPRDEEEGTAPLEFVRLHPFRRTLSENAALRKNLVKVLRPLQENNPVAQDIIDHLEAFDRTILEDTQKKAVLETEAIGIAELISPLDRKLIHAREDEDSESYQMRLIVLFEDNTNQLTWTEIPTLSTQLSRMQNRGSIGEALRSKIDHLAQSRVDTLAKWDRILSMLPEGPRKNACLAKKTFLRQKTTPKQFRKFDNVMQTQLLKLCSLQELQAFLEKVEDSPEEKALAPLSQAMRSFVRNCENARTGWTLLSSFLRKHGQAGFAPLEIQRGTTEDSLLERVTSANLHEQLQSIPVGERKRLRDALLSTFAPGDRIGEALLLIQSQIDTLDKWNRILSMLPGGPRQTLESQKETFLRQHTTPEKFRAFDNVMQTQLLTLSSLQELQAFLEQVEKSPEKKALAPLSQAVRSVVSSIENASRGWTLLSSFLLEHGKDGLAPLEIQQGTTLQSLLKRVTSANLHEQLQSIPVAERQPLIDELRHTFEQGDRIGEALLSALFPSPSPPTTR